MTHPRPAASAPTLAAADPVLLGVKRHPRPSRADVATTQTFALHLALAGLVAESGYDAVTVRALIRRARLSTSTFYRHYDGIEACLVGMISMFARTLMVRASVRMQPEGAAGNLRLALHNVLETLAQDPEMTQVVFVESFSAGPLVREELASSQGAFESRLAVALGLAPRPAVGTTYLAAGLVAGLVGTIRRTTLTGRAGELPGLADELAVWMLSVAHEEVLAFRGRGSRPSGQRAEGLPGPMSAASASPESAADPSRRAVMATARLAAMDGPAALTSAQIRKDAGLSRREFEQHFSGVEDCFLDAVESVSLMAADTARIAAGDAGSWEGRVLKAMSALCEIAAGDRGLSRLVLLDITAPGRTGLLRRENLIDRWATRFCHQAPADKRPSELAAVASVSAVWRIAETEVAAGRTPELSRVAPVFTYILLASRCARFVSAAAQRPPSNEPTSRVVRPMIS